MEPPKLYIATKNSHKIKEIAAILPERWQVLSLAEFGDTLNWVESGDTFVANARIKAQAVRQVVGPHVCILADDSGLCVDALGGAPGVYSSRYAGTDGDDQANNEKLLNALAGQDNRTARFVCVLVFIDALGNESIFRGECPGTIIASPRGHAGFGYDPLFLPQQSQETMAELFPDAKNRISHRRQALDLWIASLQEKSL